MHPYLVVVLCAAAVVGCFILEIVREQRRSKKMLLQKVRRIYGKVPEREYETGDLEKISHYFRRKGGDRFVIDDITWNDLDMDRIYRMVNQTMSSPGEDVLYAMMRTPLFTQEELKEREELVDFFASHEKEREELQWYLAQVGKNRYGSLSDVLFALEDAPEISPLPHLAMDGALLLALASMLVSPLHGFLLFMVLCIVSSMQYLGGKERTTIEMYLSCFSSLMRILSAADDMGTVDWPQVRRQMEKIREGKAAFAGVRRRMFLLTSKNDGMGSPAQAVLDYARMLFHVDILAYNSSLRAIKERAEPMMLLLDNMGELDAAISIASFRELLPLRCKPEFLPWEGGQIRVQAEDLYHPLIQEAVANSLEAAGGILITGSNASGKSTFLKNMALNSILAQTLGICTCSRYRAPFLKVMTSMALRDDLASGESYFIVEINSLKRILTECEKEEPLLCVIDEVLRGTNTIERIAASSRILKALSRSWTLPLAATHDIELSYILEDLYENYHFQEEVTENRVVFPYLLKKGRASSRNAIRLLGILGYDPELVEEASRAAAEFERTGVWEKLRS